MILYRGEKRTPKEMAAIVVREKLDELPADWKPDAVPGSRITPGEQATIIEQIERYKERFFRILAVMDGEEPSAAPEGRAS